MKTKFLKWTITILSLIYLIADITFFIVEKVKYDFVVLEFPYPPIYEIALRWITSIIIILFYLKSMSQLKLLVQIFCVIVLLNFSWNLLNGNIYFGSVVYMMGLIEIVALLIVINNLYLYYKKRMKTKTV